MSIISIPNPCGEDWNQMTPSRRGAFCQKCQIDVIDFTSKSPSEIRKILKASMGQSLCGHIRPSQLQQLNEDFYAWRDQSEKSLQFRFLMACMLVFGMSLFSGCQSGNDDQTLQHLAELKAEILADTLNLATTDTTVQKDSDSLQNSMPDNTKHSMKPTCIVTTGEIVVDSISITPQDSPVDGGIGIDPEFRNYLENKSEK